MKVNALKGFRNAVYCCIVPCQLANELLLINSSDNDTVLTTKGGGIDRSWFGQLHSSDRITLIGLSGIVILNDGRAIM